MTSEKQQQLRRAVRTAIYSITVLASLVGLAWIIHLMRTDAPTLRIIATGLLFVVGISVLGYTAENVTQRISFHAGPDGLTGDIDGTDATTKP